MKIGDKVFYTNPWGYIPEEECEIMKFCTSDDGKTERAFIIGKNTRVITNLTNLRKADNHL